MASSGNSFIDEHQDFVLKLKINASDGASQIRRVRLPRIADKNGGVSYDELVGLVVTFTFPEDTPESYSVSLTYTDVDEDTVTIASTDELEDAIEQFAGKKVLRISTEVKPKAKVGAAKAKAAPGTTTKPPAKTVTSSSQTEQALNPQLKTVLESFVGVLSTAVAGLQEGLVAPEATPAQEPRHTAAPKKAPCADNDEGEITSKPAPPREVQNVAERAAGAAASGESEAAASSPPPPPSPPQEAEKTDRPFIHGRHTCDSCLTTPIVGKRYNAVNLPDYDLCAKCFKNYKGNEVRFEAVELDRDRAFQERWHRRRERIENAKKPAANRKCGGRGRRRWGRTNEPTPAEPAPQEKKQEATTQNKATDPPQPCPPPPPHFPHGPPSWAHLGPHAAPHFAPHFGPHAHPHMPHAHPHFPPPHHHPHAHRPHGRTDNTGGFDDALKEAIRRSLRDVAPEEAKAPPAAAAAAAAPPVDDAATTPPAGTPAPSVDSASVTPMSEGSVATAKSTQDEVADTAEENAASDAEEIQDKDVAAPDDEEADVETGVPPAQKLLEDTKPTPEDTKTVEVSLGDDSFPSSDSEKNQEVAAESTPAAASFAGGVGRDDSFASDAVGSGDVAEAMGATLDMVAGVISEMLSEAESYNKSASPREQKTDLETDSAGELILNSVQSASGKVSHEENDWQLVKPDKDDEAENGSDNEIGRAAEMLGSALFNSDMQSTAENVSALSASDSFSVPSTVPSITSSPRAPAPAQVARWSSQLSTLRELGFEEGLCIETLERLQAANIGVGCDDDITVTQVVNEIMGQK